MKLTDFLIIAQSKKKLLIITSVVTAALLLVPTVFMSINSRSITAGLKLESSMMLSAPETPTIDSGYSLSVAPVIPSDKLDDKAAVDYLQNSKSQWKSSGLIDYSALTQKVSDKAFINSVISSSEFKSYLKTEGVIQNNGQLSIVEQSDTLSIKLSGDDSDTIMSSYEKLLELIPPYVDSAIKQRLTTASNGLQSAVSSDTVRIDGLIAEYTALKTETTFADMVSYNKGLTILNSVSVLSGNVSANSDTLQKLSAIQQNDLSPDIQVKSFSDSGLSPIKSLIPYLIIELLAALLIGCLAVFLSALFAKAKAGSRA